MRSVRRVVLLAQAGRAGGGALAYVKVVSPVLIPDADRMFEQITLRGRLRFIYRTEFAGLRTEN